LTIFIFVGLSVAYIKNFDLSEERDKEKNKNCLIDGEKKRSNNFRLRLLFNGEYYLI
jgi:hypothetical protein